MREKQTDHILLRLLSLTCPPPPMCSILLAECSVNSMCLMSVAIHSHVFLTNAILPLTLESRVLSSLDFGGLAKTVGPFSVVQNTDRCQGFIVWVLVTHAGNRSMGPTGQVSEVFPSIPHL